MMAKIIWKSRNMHPQLIIHPTIFSFLMNSPVLFANDSSVCNISKKICFHNLSPHTVCNDLLSCKMILHFVDVTGYCTMPFSHYFFKLAFSLAPFWFVMHTFHNLITS